MPCGLALDPRQAVLNPPHSRTYSLPLAHRSQVLRRQRRANDQRTHFRPHWYPLNTIRAQRLARAGSSLASRPGPRLTKTRRCSLSIRASSPSSRASGPNTPTPSRSSRAVLLSSPNSSTSSSRTHARSGSTMVKKSATSPSPSFPSAFVPLPRDLADLLPQSRRSPCRYGSPLLLPHLRPQFGSKDRRILYSIHLPRLA